jgi:hypothetical protein
MIGPWWYNIVNPCFSMRNLRSCDWAVVEHQSAPRLIGSGCPVELPAEREYKDELDY